ncbi:MgtC/SapB family protein [Rhodococcus sp. JVH1]|uniref:MgtC/SapB family protein n=1 Tax=Rhodococcus sp. JVH1 TaxID=745408 RepID=UPI000271EEA9|nr:MgtC/SapB family protein [Rhodococcus sp. JVH1]EJJ01716.1 mgtC family protein [Rhodococcus sp. JVH1]
MTGVSVELVPLVVAFVLSSMIGIEREMRHKVAGLRTHALVGMGAAMFMLISKYGFDDILDPGRVILNPSQLSGQIVTGIGFLGGGIIFVRHGSARGIITAASIWVVAAVGMAAGAGLYTLAVAGTIGELIITLAYTPVTERLRRNQDVVGELALTYRQGTGVLRQAMTELTRIGCTVEALSVLPTSDAADTVCVVLEVRGPTKMTEIATNLAQIPGVVAARTGPASNATYAH